MKKTKVGIIGATGYVGVELIRLLLNHKNVEISGLGSNSFVSKSINDLYPSLGLNKNIKCVSSEEVIDNSEFIFLALPHGVSEKFALKALKENKKVIDLGADFRLKNEEELKEWYDVSFIDKIAHRNSVYGLSEIYREDIRNSRLIANPGCYPTSISLPMMPLLKSKLIKKDNIIIDSKSGVTGSGREPSLGTHYPEINESIYAYKIGNHRHTPEIEQNLSDANGEKVDVIFTPTLIPVNRGILSTIYCEMENGIGIENIHKKLTEFYETEKFVEVMDLNKFATIKNVKFTNKCQISIHQNKDKLIVCSVIDNMIKGAAGQAIQNMNIMLGFDEGEGLTSVAPAF